jgi:hypothetical protein
MKRDIRACSRSELDEINREIAKYKAMRSGAKQSEVSTQLVDAEKATNSEILKGSLHTDDDRIIIIKSEQGTINAEQLELL